MRADRVRRVKPTRLILLALPALGAALLAGCTSGAPPTTAAPATPTIAPAIYNQVPVTHVFEPGQCSAILEVSAPAYTSNTIGGQPSGEIAPGTYQVGVSAQYSASLWYGLNDVGTANYINAASAAKMVGECAQGQP